MNKLKGGLPYNTDCFSYWQGTIQASYAVMRQLLFAYVKTKVQISCAVSAWLIRAFVFSIKILQFLDFLNLKFLASYHLLWLYSLVCVGSGTGFVVTPHCEETLWGFLIKYDSNRPTQLKRLCRVSIVRI